MHTHDDIREAPQTTGPEASDLADFRELVDRFPARYLPALLASLRLAEASELRRVGSLCGSEPLTREKEEQERQCLRQAAEQARSEGREALAQGFEAWASGEAWAGLQDGAGLGGPPELS